MSVYETYYGLPSTFIACVSSVPPIRLGMKLFSFVTTIALVVFSQVFAQAQVAWMSWEEAVAANEAEPRKIFVDVYTDWCGWCKRMDSGTFTDERVVELLNEHFYAVKFDAEQREDVTFGGKTYKFESGGRNGVHGLAKLLLQGRLGYPTVVFLDEDIQIIQPVPGYQEADAFAKITRYFADDAYRTVPWAEYEDH